MQLAPADSHETSDDSDDYFTDAQSDTLASRPPSRTDSGNVGHAVGKMDTDTHTDAGTKVDSETAGGITDAEAVNIQTVKADTGAENDDKDNSVDRNDDVDKGTRSKRAPVDSESSLADSGLVDSGNIQTDSQVDTKPTVSLVIPEPTSTSETPIDSSVFQSALSSTRSADSTSRSAVAVSGTADLTKSSASRDTNTQDPSHATDTGTSGKDTTGVGTDQGSSDLETRDLGAADPGTSDPSMSNETSDSRSGLDMSDKGELSDGQTPTTAIRRDSFLESVTQGIQDPVDDEFSQNNDGQIRDDRSNGQSNDLTTDQSDGDQRKNGTRDEDTKNTHHENHDGDANADDFDDFHAPSTTDTNAVATADDDFDDFGGFDDAANTMDQADFGEFGSADDFDSGFTAFDAGRDSRNDNGGNGFQPGDVQGNRFANNCSSSVNDDDFDDFAAVDAPPATTTTSTTTSTPPDSGTRGAAPLQTQTTLPFSTNQQPIPDFTDLTDADDISSLIAPHLDIIFPYDQLETPSRPPFVPQLDHSVFTTPRSASLWSQLAVPPPLAPPDWVRSRIRRLFLVSLGVPVDLDEVLPASNKKRLILPDLVLRPDTQDKNKNRGDRDKPDKHKSDKSGVGRVQTANRSSSTDSRRTKGLPSKAVSGAQASASATDVTTAALRDQSTPDSKRASTSMRNSTGPSQGQGKSSSHPALDFISARQLCSLTDARLASMTDDELQAHVDQLRGLEGSAKATLQYWQDKKKDKEGDKEAFEGVIENLVKHAQKVRR